MDIFTAIRELTRFDHAVCDARVVAHHVPFSRFVFKGGSSFEGIYIGSAFIVVWSAVIIVATVNTYRTRRNLAPRYRSWLWFGPLLCGVAIISLVAQGFGLIEYVNVCRSLLNRS